MSRFTFQGTRGGQPEPPTLGRPEFRHQQRPSEIHNLTCTSSSSHPVAFRFRVAAPVPRQPEERDKPRFCEYHKDFGHKTNSCFRLQCLLNYLVSKGHFQEYVESSTTKGPPPPSSASQRPVIDTILAAPKMVHAWGQPNAGILVARVNYSFTSGSARPVDGLLPFSESSLRQLAQPHDNVLVLTLEVGRHFMKCILVDLGNATDLLYLLSLIWLGYKPNNKRNPRRILVGFNGTRIHSVGEIVLPLSADPVTTLVSLTVIDEPSNFNAILSHS